MDRLKNKVALVYGGVGSAGLVINQQKNSGCFSISLKQPLFPYVEFTN
ncbi:hypothetical protein AAHN97_14060 [Chitinophaga niabensis]